MKSIYKLVVPGKVIKRGRCSYWVIEVEGALH